MKWRDRIPTPEGDLRDRQRFLLWPLRIEKETRWWEVARWCEQAVAVHTHGVRKVQWQPISRRQADTTVTWRNFYRLIFG